MKRGKNPTAAQKAWLASKGLNCKEWLIVKWEPAKATISHRETGEIRELPL